MSLDFLDSSINPELSKNLPSDYTVKEITADEANYIVKKYHYSGKVVANSSLHLGIFRDDTNKLVGCLQFGPPMNGDKTFEKISNSTKAYELNRMVMADSEPRNAESMAISRCFKWLKKNSDIDWILSFSDGKEGNVGYIYQATNWKYIGYILSKSFWELDGNIMHSVSVWHKYKENHEDRDIKTTNEILCDNFDNVSNLVCKQHVYVFPIKKNVKFNFEERKYPKLEQEIPIIKRTWIKKNGIVEKSVDVYTNEVVEGIF